MSPDRHEKTKNGATLAAVATWMKDVKTGTYLQETCRLSSHDRDGFDQDTNAMGVILVAQANSYPYHQTFAWRKAAELKFEGGDVRDVWLIIA